MGRFTFAFELQVTERDVASAVFASLRGAAVALYNASRLSYWIKFGTRASVDLRRRWALMAFNEVASVLEEDSPFRRELLRYAQLYSEACGAEDDLPPLGSN
jgi:hypothetical protein